MKSFFLGITLSFVCMCSVSGQFSLLLEGGANYGKTHLSNKNLGDYIKQEDIMGYFLGITSKYQATNLLKVNLELQYSVEGFKAGSFRYPSQVDLQYFRFIPELEVRAVGPLSVFAGVNIGLLAIEGIQGRIEESITYTGNEDFVKKMDLGVLAGINLNLLGVNLSIKYNLGLKDIGNISWTDRVGDSIGESALKNRFLQVGVGYLIDFKR